MTENTLRKNNRYKEHKVIEVRDHDRLTGKNREPAHVVCNLKARSSYTCFMRMALYNMC